MSGIQTPSSRRVDSVEIHMKRTPRAHVVAGEAQLREDRHAARAANGGLHLYHTQCTRRSEKSAQMQWRVRALCEPWCSTGHVHWPRKQSAALVPQVVITRTHTMAWTALPVQARFELGICQPLLTKPTDGEFET